MGNYPSPPPCSGYHLVTVSEHESPNVHDVTILYCDITIVARRKLYDQIM